VRKLEWSTELKGFVGAVTLLLGGVLIILGVIPGLVLLLGIGLFLLGLWIMDK